jgi:lysophospholipase L1-like esterase
MGFRLCTAICILSFFLTLPAQKSLAAPAQTEISGKYTYWIEMTSLTAEEEESPLRSGPIASVPYHPRKIYIPFFAINEGKIEIPLKAWEKGDGRTISSFPEKLYSDRHLTVEDNGIDLTHGFQRTGPQGLVQEADYFPHAVYGHAAATGLFKAEFKITRQPNQFANQTEADIALFDRQLIDVFVRDTDEPEGPLTFLRKIAMRAAGTLIDLLLIVDRVLAEPRSMTTPDYLARISQPSSRFYADYVDYKQGRITEYDLIRRLPHVAMIGDSLVKNMYVASILSMFWRVRTEHQRNWFLDTDKSPDSIYSIYERLEEFTPLVAVEHSGAGANVDSGKSGDTFFQMLSKTRNYSQQVDQILEQERFPDLLLIWIGHNNLNWAAPLGPDERKSPEKPLLKRLWRFRKYYAHQLERLVDRAKKEKHKTVIVVFGVVNFEAFFKARRAAGLLKEKDPELYPHFETGYRIFVSMRPEYQHNMIRLALMMNAELRNLVDDLNQELRSYPNVRLEYSDALATADLSSVELVHPVDAWHPSVKGHNRLAEAAFSALSNSLRFLGILPK